MRRRLIVVLALCCMPALPAVASAAPARTLALTPGRQAGWAGPPRAGANPLYDAAAGTPCGTGLIDGCDTTLLDAGTFDDAFYETHRGSLRIDAGEFAVPASDFDLYVYRSDPAGHRGAVVASSASTGASTETVTIDEPTGHYLVQVVYYLSTGSYTGRASLSIAEGGPAPVPDVDAPPGVQESLASDPALGFRSHSEPHIAQSPVDPDVMVAGSKMYNRDADSLKEYEFKIGTYASFDRGRTWRDLGQLDVCPPEQAPPASWPDNTCYPSDDPARAGTGAEDAPETRPGGDYGEEYMTSDVWTGFDDEGNAYAMILDSPPFVDRAGWGMSFHRWPTPSAADVAAGATWGPKVVIDHYPQEKGNVTPPDNRNNPLGLLDDKNTFAVNNAGPDGDGRTGTILACWGQNLAVAIKQQTVCKHSTDGGRTFAGNPLPVSGAQQLVLGVYVLADRRDPDTFYVYWKGYETQIATSIAFGLVGDLPGEAGEDIGTGLGPHTVLLYGARTTDGGRTFTAPIPIRAYQDLASPLPGTTFRTGSMPQAAQAKDGTVYVVFDAYNPAGRADSDNRTADVMMIRSRDGLTFGAPVKVNQDGGAADQFQGTVAVADDGQLSVGYLDRRLDPRNAFVDAFVSQSSDGGATWADTRLSHDGSDTAVNPPIADASISSPGTFYGDYQGIVADTCGALFLHNDTHLANAPSRDPDFDQGVPRSRFQQVQAARLARPGSEGRPECAAPVTASSRCAQTRAFGRASVRARGRGLRFAFAARPRGVVDVAVRQVSAGRGLLASRPVARFARRGSFAWDGRPTAGGRRSGDGFYVVTLRRRGAAGGRDVRRFAFERRGGRFVRRGRFAAARSCSVLARFELDRPVFGGRRSAPLTVRYRLRERAAVSVVLRRGARRPEVTTMFKPTRAGRTQRLRISPRGRPRGTYTVQLRVRRPGADLVRRTLSARRL